MRAVNLLPEDERKGGGAGAAGRSGGIVYLLLGGLAGLAVMVGLWATASHGLGGKRAALTALQQETTAANARIAGTQGPTDLAARRRAQSIAVLGLVEGRYDWASTLDAIGRTLPADTTLNTLEATVAGAAGAPGAAAAPASSTAAPGGPSIQLGGCAPGQRAVARLMPRLRTIPGVQTVTLLSSALADDAGAGGATSAAAQCAGASFELSLALNPPTGLAALAGAAGTAPAGAAPAPAPAAAPTTTTPAATTPAPAPGAAQTAVPGTPTPTAAPKP